MFLACLLEKDILSNPCCVQASLPRADTAPLCQSTPDMSYLCPLSALWQIDT